MFGFDKKRNKDLLPFNQEARTTDETELKPADTRQPTKKGNLTKKAEKLGLTDENLHTLHSKYKGPASEQITRQPRLDRDI